MRQQRGFTLVELLIVIAIMSILLVLGVVNLRSGQISARDQERKVDVENIMRGLEGFYINSANNARYPSTYISEAGTTDAFVQAALRNIDIKSLQAPGVAAGTRSLVSATSTNEATTGISPAPAPTVSQYIYQPFQPDGTLCTLVSQECRRYNIFYRLEGDGTIYKASSKNQ
ncbi:MAG: type II secretion system protein [Candidatus Saccharimonadales bacterium]